MNQIDYYYHRVTMAFDDLLYCRDYVVKLMDPNISKDIVVHSALTTALIVSYARVFTSSNTIDRKYKEEVSNKFGALLNRWKRNLPELTHSFHVQLLTNRDEAIAHSDACSRNYRSGRDKTALFGNNPYVPFDSDEVIWANELINSLLNVISKEQSNVAKVLPETNT